MSQDHNDVILTAAFEWAERNKYNLGASVLAHQIKNPNAKLRSQWNDIFLDACAKQPWENVQNWMKVLTHKSIVEMGACAAIRSGQIETAQHLLAAYPVDNDNALIASVVKSGRPEMVRVVLEHYPREEITSEFLASFSVNTTQLGLMAPDMIEFLAGYFDSQEINSAWQFAEKHEHPLVDGNAVEQSRDFFGALVARQQQLAITKEVDHTPHMVCRVKM